MEKEEIKNSIIAGALYIVSTPIGNLGDMTFRAVEILKSVTFIAAEDTRHVQKLLQHYDIKTPSKSFHSYSSDGRLDEIIEALKNQKSVALVSDAGTPGISDPGYTLIKKAIENGVQIIPIPGASALLPALVGSGLPTHHFAFYGFLPLKKGRQTLLKSWINEEDKTIVFYESPHRIQRTLENLLEFLGPNWDIVLARELTKIYEEFLRGSLTEVTEIMKKRTPKGEFVVVLKKAVVKKENDD